MRPQIYLSYVPRIAKRSENIGQPFSAGGAAGFKDYADQFVVDEPTVNQLLRNAKQIVDCQCGEARFSFPLKEFTALLKVADSPADRPPAIEAAIIKQFQLAMVRRPAKEELERFANLMEKNIEISGPRIGVKSTLAAILLLPEAIYRFELAGGEPDEQGRVMLEPRELAYAISFALTDEAPDEPLLRAAESGELASAQAVRLHVERLLHDKKIEKPQIMRFFDQYFDYVSVVDVFKDLGGSSNKWKPEILVNDTHLLIQSVLDEDRHVLKQLLTTNKAFVNARFDAKENKYLPAKPVGKPKPKKDKKTGKLLPVPPRDPKTQPEVHDWYGLPVDWEWTDRQPLKLPREERAGIVTQPSWLAAFASNNENHPVQRGRWVRERLLGGVVPDVPISVDAKLPDAPHQTLRTRMQVTEQAYCWQCHKKMNPLGLAFEHYDYVGAYRRTEPVVDLAATAGNVDSKGNSKGTVMRDVPVDAACRLTLSGDPAINGQYAHVVELVHALADSPHVRQVFVRHAFRFWMGRNETLADAPTLLAADRAYVESDGSMKALITSLLTSDSFLYRWHEASPQPPSPN